MAHFRSPPPPPSRFRVRLASNLRPTVKELLVRLEDVEAELLDLARNYRTLEARFHADHQRLREREETKGARVVSR